MRVTKLRGGDYCPDGKGAFQGAEGAEALLERVLFLLQTRRGSFPLLPELGSRLHELPRVKPSAREALAASYAAEALREEAVTVTGAAWEAATRTVTVFLTWQGEELSAQVEV